MTDYDELARKAREATPGEWAADHKNIYLGVIEREDPDDDTSFWESAHRIYDEGGHSEADAAYIAAASPDVILALLEERKVLREVATAAREFMGHETPDMPDDEWDPMARILWDAMERYDALQGRVASREGSGT